MDHAGLALVPLSLALTEPGKHHGPVTFSFELDLVGRLQRTVVTLQPGESGELPVHGDQMVYLALLQIALRNPDPQPILEFSRKEVFDLLRWPKKGSNYDRLRSSLRRLWDLGVVIDSEITSRGGHTYGRRTEMTKLINRVRIETGRGATCEIEWGDIVRQAFIVGDFKRLDWDLLMALGNPLTAQLYRILDRVTLSGESRWEVEWQPLAAVLGMNAGSYARPARLKQVLEPHCESLIRHGVIDGYEYLRGGRFVFHVRNYLRVQIRRVLQELGVFDRAASQVLNSHDEVAIMLQCDCLQHGTRPKPETAGGFLVEAIRRGYELRYPDHELQHFKAMWGVLSDEEQREHHAAGVRVLAAADDLLDTNTDPAVWSMQMRAVVRFMVCHSIDPAQVLWSPSSPLPTGLLAGPAE